jgi:hypothetical protein
VGTPKRLPAVYDFFSATLAALITAQNTKECISMLDKMHNYTEKALSVGQSDSGERYGL